MFNNKPKWGPVVVVGGSTKPAGRPWWRRDDCDLTSTLYSIALRKQRRRDSVFVYSVQIETLQTPHVITARDGYHTSSTIRKQWNA